MTQKELDALAEVQTRLDDIAFYAALFIIAAVIVTVLIVRAVRKRRLARDYGIIAKPLTKEEVRAERAVSEKGKVPASSLAFSAAHIAAGGVNAARPGNLNVSASVAAMQTRRAIEISDSVKDEKSM
jgi:hypothetical protein